MIAQVLHHLRALVACDTQNPPRRITAADPLFVYLAERLAEAAFSVETHDLDDGCVWMLARRGAPKLLFNFHVDTVPVGGGWSGDPLALRVVGDLAIGRGACDVKGAAACMLAAVGAARGDVALLFSSDEEAGQDRCVRDFLDREPDYEGVIVGEPTGRMAVLGHRGLATATGVFAGVPGHASAPRALDDSAIHAAVRWTVSALAEAARQEQITVGGLRGIRFNVGTIAGGTKANMIAERAELRFGVRPRPGEDPVGLVAQLTSSTEARVSWTPGFVGLPLPPPGRSTDGAARLAERLGLAIGPPVDFWSEAPLFAAAGLPALVFGPGSIDQAHATDEQIAVDELAAAAATYARILGGGSLA